MINQQPVLILVFDHTGTVLVGARVILRSITGERTIELVFDETAQAYRAPEYVEPGEYTAQVSAEGYEGDERIVQVDPAGLTATFVLGKQGLSFLYRGTVRMPFERQPDLLAIQLEADVGKRLEESGKIDDAFVAAPVHELGSLVERVEVGEQITRQAVVVVRFHPNVTEEQRREFVRALAQVEGIRAFGPVIRLDGESVSFLGRELVVKFKAHITLEEVPSIAHRYNLEVQRHIPYAGNTFVLQTAAAPSYDLLDDCETLVKSGFVEYAEPNLYGTAVYDAINPTDFLYANQWHLPFIGLPDAWQVLRDSNPAGVLPGDSGDRTFGSQNIIISVMDSGVETQTPLGIVSPRHPDFQGNVTGGASKFYRVFDFTSMVANNNTTDGDHGSNCAGVATGRANNASVVAGENEGIVGAAGNCRLIAARTGTNEVNMADAYIWIAGFDPDSPLATFPAPINPGADVITNSFGFSSGMAISGLMRDCFDYLTTYGRGGKGVVLCFSAGNANSVFNLLRPWAAYEKTIAVAASTDADVKAWYSNFGNGIDVCAPSNGGTLAITTATEVGTGALAGHTGGGLDYINNFGGTSSATPLTAGVAALMLSINPRLTWVELREILRDTAVQIDAANTDPVGQWSGGYSQWYGFGRIDANAAVIGARDYGHTTDIVVRENVADTGAVPSASPWWHSPDIWVRRADEPIPALAYNANPPHQNAERGHDNFVYCRVKNIGTRMSNEVYIRAMITHFGGMEFRYPTDFIPTNRPGQAVAVPMPTGTYLIGETKIDNLAPGADQIVKMRWPAALIPPETVNMNGVNVAWHPCLLLEASPHDGIVPASSGWDIQRDNNIAQRNITIVNAGEAVDAFFAGIVMGTSDLVGVQSLVLDRSQLSDDARVFVRFADDKIMSAVTKYVKAVLAGEEPGGESYPPRRKKPCGVEILVQTRLAIKCCDGSSIIIKAPAGTHIGWQTGGAPFKLATYQGQEVVEITGAESVVELPVRVPGQEFTPLMVGISRSDGDGPLGELALTQRRGDGELSAGYGIAAE